MMADVFGHPFSRPKLIFVNIRRMMLRTLTCLLDIPYLIFIHDQYESEVFYEYSTSEMEV